MGTAYVIVDVCAAHGTWFDQNELRLVFAAQIGKPLTVGTVRASAQDGFDQLFKLLERL